MIHRLTNEKQLNKFPRYKECAVCSEWLNFDNFSDWYDENYYEVENEKMCLDKDILVKGNKIYSPENCIFVPNSINTMFTKSEKSRGKYPIGVCYEKESGKYKAQLSFQENIGSKKKKKNLGRFENEIDAFNKYKKCKEEYIKIVADRYKESIPNKLYKTLYNYKVELED